MAMAGKQAAAMPKWIWLVVLAIATVGFSAAEEEVVTITLQEYAEIDTEQITLGQIAALSGPQEQTEKLATVTLGPAPLAGHQRAIELGCINLRLRRAGWNPEEFVFAGTQAPTVARPGHLVGSSASLSGQGWPAHNDGRQRQTTADSDRQRQIWVKRGDKVRIVLKYKAITIATAGQVMGQAAKDQLVEVRVVGSSNTIYAQVISPRTVQVEL